MTDSWTPPTDQYAPRTPLGVGFWVLMGVVAALATTVLGFLVLSQVRYRAFEIPTSSMQPTLHAGDHVLVRRTHDVHVGDIVVFDGAGSFDDGLSSPRHGDYVKRVIALGGQHVHETAKQVVVDGRTLDEPYVSRVPDPFESTLDVTVPPGRMWVLGDNRANSSDSRFHVHDGHHGTVAVASVVGVVVRQGSLGHVYALPLLQVSALGLMAGVAVTGGGLLRRRTLVR